MFEMFLYTQCPRLRTVPPFPWQPRARSTSPGSPEPMAARPSRPSAWSTDVAAALSGWWPLITSHLSSCRWKFATWSPVSCNRASRDPKWLLPHPYLRFCWPPSYFSIVHAQYCGFLLCLGNSQDASANQNGSRRCDARKDCLLFCAPIKKHAFYAKWYTWQ